MQQSLVLLGRQPALGIAELESLYGADALHIVGRQTAIIDLAPQDIQFSRLGGSIKLAKVLTRLETNDWRKIVQYITRTLPDHLQYIPEGKIRLGLSVDGLQVSHKDLQRSGLEIKKVIKQAGRSVRLVPNTEHILNSAQTLHNQLTGPTGLEFLIVRDRESTLLTQVINVQDINAYAARDQQRPKRDARVGMLPPKLAQIIINLAKPSEAETVLDPFCGTGVILQEALLMQYGVYGTDLEPRMIEFSKENLDWLASGDTQLNPYKLSEGDATDFQWETFDVVAAETYLGRPFSSEPDAQTLQQVMSDVNLIHKKFLQNLARQTSPGFRGCLAVPAWITRSGIKHLNLLDSLESLGYNRVSFVHADNQDLLYYRKDQIVARELLVLTRK
jgi:tRNA G10  N-methylase Trm11